MKAVLHAAQKGHQVDQRAVSMSLEKGDHITSALADTGLGIKLNRKITEDFHEDVLLPNSLFFI